MKDEGIELKIERDHTTVVLYKAQKGRVKHSIMDLLLRSRDQERLEKITLSGIKQFCDLLKVRQ